MRLTLLVFVLATTLGNVSAVAEPTRLRVLTYNIHHGEGVDEKLDLERIAKVIRAESPDLTAIQEVDRGTERARQIDEPAQLSKLTEMDVVFQKNIDHEGGDYGNVVLSNLPIKSHADVKFPSLAEPQPVEQREQRGMLVVEVEIQPGESIWFGCTHLDCRRQDQERFKSADVINEWFRSKHPQAPAVLAGDLNATPDSRVLSRLGAVWKKAQQAEIPTVPVKSPRRQIDYIMYQPANRWRTVETRVLEESVASDHRAYVAILELLPPAE